MTKWILDASFWRNLQILNFHAQVIYRRETFEQSLPRNAVT